MNWTEVTVKTTTEAVEAISNILLEERCGGVMIEDPKDFLFQEKNELDWDYVEEEVFNKSNQDGVLIKTYIPEERNVLELVETIKAKISLLPDCGLDIGEGSVSLSNVNESDWANEWKKYYKPTKIGQKIVVKPTWEDYEVKEGDLVIELDPGMAFGTGTHETTSMCIRELEKYVDGTKRVFDIGCGSGILAIAAAKLGAREVVGTDLDADCMVSTKENMEVNHLDLNLGTFYVGNLIDDEKLQETVGTEEYEIVVANILADVIIPMAPVIPARLKKGGYFITSGIIDFKENEVKEAIEKAGLKVIEINHQGEWVNITAQKL